MVIGRYRDGVYVDGRMDRRMLNESGHYVSDALTVGIGRSEKSHSFGARNHALTT
jgi:hypothetical protein